MWQLTERVSARLKAKELAGSTVTLKLEDRGLPAEHARPVARPTRRSLRSKIFAAGRDLLAHEIDGTHYRLIGIGVSALDGADVADPADLLDPVTARAAPPPNARSTACANVRARGRGEGICVR